MSIQRGLSGPVARNMEMKRGAKLENIVPAFDLYRWLLHNFHRVDV
jgi:hypothetical protein